MSINIHGKEYITVAERLQMAKKEIKSISTEVLYQEPVVIKATVITDKGTFTGISAANPSKTIEKMSPYEVAETSAVGRALGFAGYGIVEGIATADEMKKSEPDPTDDWENVVKTVDQKIIEGFCSVCKVEISDKVAKFSADKYGKSLCYKHQKTYGKSNKN